MLRILRYLPVRCSKGAEFVAFAVCFLEFYGWTPSLLVVVRIQRNLVDSLHFPGFSGDGQRSET